MAKLSDAQFLDILRRNGAIAARTVEAIRKEYKIEYSRQAVYQRMRTFPEEVQDIIEESIDVAEEQLIGLIRTCKNPNVKLNAIKYFLDAKGKERGYNAKEQAPTKVEVEIKDRED